MLKMHSIEGIIVKPEMVHHDTGGFKKEGIKKIGVQFIFLFVTTMYSVARKFFDPFHVIVYFISYLMIDKISMTKERTEGNIEKGD
jgi:hypothetical protein